MCPRSLIASEGQNPEPACNFFRFAPSGECVVGVGDSPRRSLPP